MQPLSSWLYTSTSSMPAAEIAGTVPAIIDRARIRNASLGLTGAVIFTGKRFVQMLEGPPASVAILQTSILGDRRHADIFTISEVPIHSRLFGEWEMAYAGPSPFVASVVDRSLARALAGERSGVAALIRLLKQFSPSASGAHS